VSDKVFFHIWRTDTGEGTTMRDCTYEHAEAVRERHYGPTGRIEVHYEKDIHEVMADFSKLRGQKGLRTKVRRFWWRRGHGRDHS
jgi:hypothetical protein